MSNAMENTRNGSFTYGDYCTWDDSQGQRWELIDGWAYAMAAPNATHQTILLDFGIKFRQFLRGKMCKVFIAPFDVRLNHDKGDDTVVQPDLLVVCDPAKIVDGKSARGAPDLVIEILSPSTAKHDRIVKFNKYRQAGVKEIWLVEPELGVVEVHKIGQDKLQHQFDAYLHTEKVVVGILPELTIDLNDIFEQEAETETEAE